MFQHRMKAILDSWLKVQAAWLYLEPIFGSQDIRNQIPIEGKMFEQVDGNWYVYVTLTSLFRGLIVNAPGKVIDMMG